MTRYLHQKTKSIFIEEEYLVAACRSKQFTLCTLCNKELFRFVEEGRVEVVMRCFSEHNCHEVRWVINKDKPYKAFSNSNVFIKPETSSKTEQPIHKSGD